MLSFLSFILIILFNSVKSKKQLPIRITLLEKELEIHKRRNQKRKLKIKQIDRIICSILNLISNVKDKISIVKPETLLKWQCQLIKLFWTFKSMKRKKGRSPVPYKIKLLVLKIKNENLYWGAKKIQGELLKLNIELDKKTIRNIIIVFRERGLIKKSLSWWRFLKIQAKSIYAMDFFIVDTILNQRFYVLFMIHHATREIVQFAVTNNPIREFVRQQIIELENSLDSIVYLIRDNASQFNLKYLDYGIKELRTSVMAPNMNSIAERFVGSRRREALEYFLIFREKQIRNILNEYISYYNSSSYCLMRGLTKMYRKAINHKLMDPSYQIQY